MSQFLDLEAQLDEDEDEREDERANEEGMYLQTTHFDPEKLIDDNRLFFS